MKMNEMIYTADSDSDERNSNSEHMVTKTESPLLSVLAEKCKPTKCNQDQSFSGFCERIKTNTYEPISSGFPSIDSALDGGFIRSDLVVLGGPPAVGKSSLCAQLAENIAMNGDADVIYINVEMNVDVMYAHALTRIIAKNNNNSDIKTKTILYSKRATEEEHEMIDFAIKEYKTKFGQCFVYKTKDTLEDLLNGITNYYQNYKRTLVLCIDYIQILFSGDEKIKEKIQNMMQRLNEFARSNHAIVFVIAANNRESTKKGMSGVNSARDSSSIEYYADIMLGMERVDSEDKEAAKKGDRIRIRVNKTRLTSYGGTPILRFNGESSHFEDLSEQVEDEKKDNTKCSGEPTECTDLPDDDDYPF